MNELQLCKAMYLAALQLKEITELVERHPYLYPLFAEQIEDYRTNILRIGKRVYDLHPDDLFYQTSYAQLVAAYEKGSPS